MPPEKPETGAVRGIREGEGLEQLVGARHAPSAMDRPLEAREQHEVLARRRAPRRRRGTGRRARCARAPRRGARATSMPSIVADAVVELGEGGEAPDRGGLARAVRPEQAVHGAGARPSRSKPSRAVVRAVGLAQAVGEERVPTFAEPGFGVIDSFRRTAYGVNQ